MQRRRYALDSRSMLVTVAYLLHQKNNPVEQVLGYFSGIVTSSFYQMCTVCGGKLKLHIWQILL